MLVSDEEKYAEARISMTKERSSVNRDVSSEFIQGILRWLTNEVFNGNFRSIETKK